MMARRPLDILDRIRGAMYGVFIGDGESWLDKLLRAWL